ncbi:16620_t:CDS:2 [Funneliformis mosseae]|uniref:16620_t:CDS:1 n=1 Tax=Funneliformis mosseae TaxID=27381 RepID=A0A9N9B8Y4_FUNMO|nr:16620_t:CDS:2 [Funneliformis mosseae]
MPILGSEKGDSVLEHGIEETAEKAPAPEHEDVEKSCVYSYGKDLPRDECENVNEG